MDFNGLYAEREIINILERRKKMKIIKDMPTKPTKPKLRAIYTPEGAAGEYAKYGLNLINGCDFGCLYCYNHGGEKKAGAMWRTLEDYTENPILIKKASLNKLERDCKDLQGTDAPPIHLTFVGDPYQTLDLELQLTRQAIEMIKRYGLTVQLLTKSGVDRVSRDFDLLEPGVDWIGSTLTLLNSAMSKKWEPGAPLPEERIGLLQEAKLRGFKTWVSLEPVLNPSQSLRLIEKTYEFVDLFWVGKLNTKGACLPEVKDLEASIDWREFAYNAKDLLEQLGCYYKIKESLRGYM